MIVHVQIVWLNQAPQTGRREAGVGDNNCDWCLNAAPSVTRGRFLSSAATRTQASSVSRLTVDGAPKVPPTRSMLVRPRWARAPTWCGQRHRLGVRQGLRFEFLALMLHAGNGVLARDRRTHDGVCRQSRVGRLHNLDAVFVPRKETITVSSGAAGKGG